MPKAVKRTVFLAVAPTQTTVTIILDGVFHKQQVQKIHRARLHDTFHIPQCSHDTMQAIIPENITKTRENNHVIKTGNFKNSN